jgi:uncharacterized protein (TIGR02001 family)
MRIAFPIALAMTFAAGLVPVARATGQLDAGIAFSSDYVLYGLTRSQGKPVVQAQLGWANEHGWSAGTWFSTVDFNDGPGISRELDFYLAKRWSLGQDFALATELTQYTFNEPRSFPSHDYSELRVALSFREMLELSASVSPDYLMYVQPYSHGGITYGGLTPRQTVFTYSATARLPATRYLSFNLGAGRFDLGNLLGATYTYWSAGGELAFGRLNLAVHYIGTDGVARQFFGSEQTDDRLVATLALRIP